MTGDYTRDTTAHGRSMKYSRLLMQQGRVALDADWMSKSNENVSCHARWHATRSGTVAPRSRPGFGIRPGGAGGFTLGAGRLYAEGVLVELDNDTPVGDQPFGGGILADVPNGTRALVYLEASEREVTALDDGRLREESPRRTRHDDSSADRVAGTRCSGR